MYDILSDIWPRRQFGQRRGALDQWPAWGRLLFKALGGHAGDNRYWPDIDAWAERIAQDLRTQD